MTTLICHPRRQAEKTALPAVILAEGGNPVKYLSRVA